MNSKYEDIFKRWKPLQKLGGIMTTLEIKDNLRLKMTTKKKDGLFGLFVTGGPRPGRWKNEYSYKKINILH